MPVEGAKAFARFAREKTLPGIQYNSVADLLRKAGDIGTTILHQVKTCKMSFGCHGRGHDRLRVLGLDGLRVVNISTMPTIIPGNTNSPVVIIAGWMAEMILQDH